MAKTQVKYAKLDSPLRAYDDALRARHPFLCGVDEAGRGPLCGPVSAAAVILDPTRPVGGINDSKKLSEKKREAVYEEIAAKAVAWAVVLVGPEEIDRLNILQATLQGMRRAVAALETTPTLVLVDGNRCPELIVPSQFVIGGDGVSESIAAASIIAKVTRDRYMRELDVQFPQYKLAKHKGYGTREHYALLAEHGIQSFYRRSFLKNWNGETKT